METNLCSPKVYLPELPSASPVRCESMKPCARGIGYVSDLEAALIFPRSVESRVCLYFLSIVTEHQSVPQPPVTGVTCAGWQHLQL